MKIILFVILLFFNFTSRGQDTIQLYLHNPAPRINQDITLTFTTEFLTNDLKEQLDSTIELNTSSINSVRFYTITFKKIGLNTVGPFKFKLNGKTYITDSIMVDIAPELPIEEGIWLRYVKFDKKEYIIVEQIISNPSDPTKFTEPFEKLFDGIQLELIDYSFSTIKPADADLFDPGFTYSIKKYELNFSTEFDEEFTLTKKHFRNLPEGIKIEPIKIK